MPLPDDYLRYPKRAYGQDHDRYPWRLAEDQPKYVLPGGAPLAVAFVIPLEWHMLNPSGRPFKHPGAMQTPYPDLRHFTARDYGNRVGAFRLLTIFRDAGVKATFAVNAALLPRIRPLIDAILADGHEIAAHGWDTDSIHWSGLNSAAEKDLVAKTRRAFADIGLTPRAWMSPARQQSFKTLDLIADAGFDICLDWEADHAPLEAKTSQGDVTLFPVLNELDDRLILTVKNHAESDWCDQIIEAAAMTASEAPRRGAQCFGITLTPYIAGLPFRVSTVREITAALKESYLVAPCSTIVEAMR